MTEKHPITGITIEADSVVVKGTDFDLLCGMAHENERLRGELSLAEEGLANYAQENAALRGFVERFQELLALDDENHPGTDLGRLMLEVTEFGQHPRGNPLNNV